jgi:hypothetical protein
MIINTIIYNLIFLVINLTINIKRYAELDIIEDDYFGNEIRLVQFSLKSEVVTYRTLVNRSE